MATTLQSAPVAISPDALETLRSIDIDNWMPCERVPAQHVTALLHERLIRYHGPCHGYEITRRGREVVRSAAR